MRLPSGAPKSNRIVSETSLQMATSRASDVVAAARYEAITRPVRRRKVGARRR